MRRKLWILGATLSLLAAAPAGAIKVYKTTSEGLADVKIYVTKSEGLAAARDWPMATRSGTSRIVRGWLT